MAMGGEIEMVVTGRARRLLRDAEVPTVELLVPGWTFERRRRRHCRPRPTLVPAERGWVIGRLGWCRNAPDDGEELIERATTVVLDRVEPSTFAPRLLARVRPTSQGFAIDMAPGECLVRDAELLELAGLLSGPRC